tara:strand:+ start:1920 stop:2876 length:957 start_codon:yes stop_codon:yes gene_type:complete
MSEYKSIHGFKVRDYTTDPDNLITGQVWYDKTNKVLQYQAAGAGAWASGGSMNQARQQFGGAGDQDDALVFGGEFSGTASSDLTELYNGISWTEVNDLNTARNNLDGTGASSTAVVATSGGGAADTELWNGTSWTEVNNLNSGRNGVVVSGIATSALATGGDSNSALNESWNGTSWTEVADLNTGRQNPGSGGVSNTSAIVFGGFSPDATAVTETWNGTAWTEVNNLNTARAVLGGAGTVSNALAFGGDAPGLSALTESWNGTSFAEQADLSVARKTLASAGVLGSASLAAGGGNSPITASTEEFTNPVLATKTVDVD